MHNDLPTTRCNGCGKLVYRCTLVEPFVGVELVCKRCCNKLRWRAKLDLPMPTVQHELDDDLTTHARTVAPYQRPFQRKRRVKTPGELERILMKRRYEQYVDGAALKERAFELTKEQFAAMWQRPCTYCSRWIEGIGIDRKDNDLGYTVENCTPCCWPCNRAKNSMSVDDFLDLCKRVAACN